MIPTNPELRQFINQFFSDDELETLCFDYFPEALNEFGGGMSKNRKVIALIGHCERRGRLDDLRAAVARERAAAWKRQFATDVAIRKPSFSEEPRFLNERDPRQIFLSHATADAEFAHTLAADLRAEGWRVWIAPESIKPGEKWVEAINRGLETSGVFVVALTPDAVASRWVKTETNAAIALEHRDRIHFLPLDVAECDIPLLWSGYQFVPFDGGYEVGLDALLRRLEATMTAGDERFVASHFSGVSAGRPDATEVAHYERHEKTGIELVRIPAGPFLYGDDQQTVDLPEYWVGRYPVTNEQFARFVAATGHKTTAEREGFAWAWTGSKWDQIKDADWRHPGGPKTTIEGKDNHPVVQVSWDDAKAFCDWAGLALPSEEEWEKAARGSDGRIWPWGNEAPTDQHGNFNGNVGATTPVGKYSPQGDSPYGCAEMAGNVWEWTDSWYDATAARRVLRGGSWNYFWYVARAAYRLNYHPSLRDDNVGCRVVRRPPSQAL